MACRAQSLSPQIQSTVGTSYSPFSSPKMQPNVGKSLNYSPDDYRSLRAAYQQLVQDQLALFSEDRGSGPCAETADTRYPASFGVNATSSMSPFPADMSGIPHSRSGLQANGDSSADQEGLQANEMDREYIPNKTIMFLDRLRRGQLSPPTGSVREQPQVDSGRKWHTLHSLDHDILPSVA